jgi:hypothetical protein
MPGSFEVSSKSGFSRAIRAGNRVNNAAAHQLDSQGLQTHAGVYKSADVMELSFIAEQENSPAGTSSTMNQACTKRLDLARS